MSQQTIQPTRMEMLRLRKRVKTAKRGHKLLKEKRDGLMKSFMAIVRDAKVLRVDVEKGLAQAFQSALFASALMGDESYQAALALPARRMQVHASTKNIMSVRVPQFEVSFEGEAALPYGLVQTSAHLDEAMHVFLQLTEQMVALAEIEHSAKLMAIEIEKTRRRVNALEHVLIPELEIGVNTIKMKLAEQERSTISVLMRVKELLAQEA